MIQQPSYRIIEKEERKIGLAVESMRRHSTDEGWQIFEGLEHAGYELCGYNLYNNYTNVDEILERFDPITMVIQDKREWDVKPGDFREKRAKFNNIESLKLRDDIFKVTILKDAQNDNFYHEQSAREMDVHAWIVYYNIDKVKELAPFVRKKHLIRTYHTVDTSKVSSFLEYKKRDGIILSGAIHPRHYPLRTRLSVDLRNYPGVIVLRHPGYHMKYTCTYDYIKYLSTFKVSICTASVYKYALRKIIESTVAGCIVVTDLDEHMPAISENLVRVKDDITGKEMLELCQHLCSKWDFEKQYDQSLLARNYYDHKKQCQVLANKIEELRKVYNNY